MTVPDLSVIPGAWEVEREREVPGGVVAFRSAPASWLCKDGSVRVRPYREYVWQAEGGEPKRLPSVSTILDAICPKPGVAHWSEARGIEGAVLAMKAGLVCAESRALDVVAIIRGHNLGAEAAKNRAARRGLNVHAINESFMRTGEVPKIGDHPPEHRGYIQAWAKWVSAREPEPVAVEQLVINPQDGYAGRLDLRANIGGLLSTVDLKTSEKAAIFPQAHWQCAMYERAAVACGDEAASRLLVVVLAADGQYREMAADHEDWRLDAALAYWRASKPIASACESANRAEKARRCSQADGETEKAP
jgi:hypothetical protein